MATFYRSLAAAFAVAAGYTLGSLEVTQGERGIALAILAAGLLIAGRER